MTDIDKANISGETITACDSVLAVAGFLKCSYVSEFGQLMDEMKLHKLMYFAQRESYIIGQRPLFTATFYGWKYGPVLKEIRSIFENGDIDALSESKVSDYTKQVVSETFKHYGSWDSWKLSSLSHGELSWKNSRIGIRLSESSDNPMREEDIISDAKRAAEFRKNKEPVISV